MKVTRLERSEEDLWDAFVEPRATSVTDHLAWRDVLQSTYRIAAHCFLAVDADGIQGCLAVFEFRHPLFGHYLTTAPFANDGGFYFDTDSARDALLEAGRNLAQERRVDYLLIRSRVGALDGFDIDDHYRTAILNLEGGSEAVWTDALRAKTRNQVRRGQREGFTIDEGPEHISAFHDVLVRHMRDLGSPSHGEAFYRNIREHLGEQARFIVIRDGDESVGGALLLESGDVAMNLHTVCLRRFNRRCPNYALYWYMIETACGRGRKTFDMGRSEADSTHLSFKSHWGAVPLPLFYNYHLVKASSIPYVDPRNPRYRLPTSVWQRLPVSIAKLAGPQLIRGIA